MKELNKPSKEEPRKISQAMRDAAANAEPDRSTETPAKPCPYAENTQEQCDVLDVAVSGRSNSDSIGPAREVRCSDTLEKRMSREQSASSFAKYYEKLNPSRRELAMDYDLVLEMVLPSDQESRVNVTGDWDRKCMTCCHPLIVIEPGQTADDHVILEGQTTSIDQYQAKTDTIQVLAEATEQDQGQQPKFSFSHFWPFSNLPVEYKIEAVSCGVRLTKDTPNESLMGLVRLFRKKDYELQMEIPAIKTWEYKPEEKEKLPLTHETECDASLLGRAKSEGGSALSGAKEATSAALEYAEGVPAKFSLKLNGSELAITKKFNEILKVAELFKKAMEEWQSFVKALSLIAGFSWEVKLSILEGKLTGKWGWRDDPSYDSKDYKWVDRYLKIEADLTVFKLEGRMMYGIQLIVPSILTWASQQVGKPIGEGELTGKLECTIKLEAKLNRKWELGPTSPDPEPEPDPELPWYSKTAPGTAPAPDPAPEPDEKKDFEGDGPIVGEFKIKITVYGFNLGFSAVVTGGFEMVGRANCGWRVPLFIKMDIHRKKTWFKMALYLPGKEDASPVVESLWCEEEKKWRTYSFFKGATF